MSRMTSVPVLLTLLACNLPAQQPAIQSPTPEGMTGVVSSVTVAEGLEHPWSIEFMPDGRMLVTERPGRLRIVSADGTVGEPVSGVPAVTARNQGGLLDVAVDPDFASNGMIYLSFSEPEGGESRASGTAVARGRLVGNALENVEVIYRQHPKVVSFGHYGSRIVFGTDGTMFITAGDRQNQRPLVQDLSTGIGKIVRINRDGSIPADNPFAANPPRVHPRQPRSPSG